MSNTSLGQQIRRARKESSLTQSELARGIVTSSMICQIENGKAFPSYNVLQALAERLGKPIEFFVSDTDAVNRQRSTFALAKALMASSSYEKAYALLKGVEEVSTGEMEDLRLALSECCQKLGRYEEASAQLDDMLTSATNNGDDKKAFTLLFRMGDISEHAGQHQLALYHWRKAYDLLATTDVDPSDRVRLLVAMGNTYYKLGFVQDAIPFFQQAYSEKDAPLSWEEVGRMFLRLALTHRDAGEQEKAAQFSEQAFAIFKSISNADLAVEVKRSRAVLLAKQGQIDEALEMLQECRLAYSIAYDSINHGITQLETAQVMQLGGRLEEAVAQVRNAITMLTEDPVEAARGHLLLASLHRELQDTPAAIHHCNVALQMLKTQGDSAFLLEALNLSVELYDEWEEFRAKKYGHAITA